MLKVYTAQYRYKGSNRLDITVKGKHSSGHYFAPTWNMVKGVKSGSMTEAQYETLYRQLIMNRYNKNSTPWNQLFDYNELVLVCFCPKDVFCHRLLLVNMLSESNPNVVTYKGEIDI